jgi:hypothetical protein
VNKQKNQRQHIDTVLIRAYLTERMTVIAYFNLLLILSLNVSTKNQLNVSQLDDNDKGTAPFQTDD